MQRNALDAQFPAMVEMYERGQKLDEVARKFGCSRKVVGRALKSLGKEPMPRTAPKEKRRGSLNVIYDGQPFDSLAALARYLGEGDPSGQTLRARLARRGAKLYALTAADVRVTEPKNRPSAVAKPYVLEGKTFPSIAAACRAHGLTRAKVEHRLARGWTQRQAFGIDPPPPRDRNQWKQTELVDGKLLPKTEFGGYKLYEITNTRNGRFYIGITVVPLEQRLTNHFQNAKHAKRTSPLYNAIRKYGREAFRIRLLRNDAKDFLELQQQEIAEIPPGTPWWTGTTSLMAAQLGRPSRSPWASGHSRLKGLRRRPSGSSRRNSACACRGGDGHRSRQRKSSRGPADIGTDGSRWVA